MQRTLAFAELLQSSKYSITHSHHRVYHQQSQSYSLKYYSHWSLPTVLLMEYTLSFTIQDLYELFSPSSLQALTIIQILCLPPFPPVEPFSASLGSSQNSPMESCNYVPEDVMVTD